MEKINQITPPIFEKIKVCKFCDKQENETDLNHCVVYSDQNVFLKSFYYCDACRMSAFMERINILIINAL